MIPKDWITLARDKDLSGSKSKQAGLIIDAINKDIRDNDWYWINLNLTHSVDEMSPIGLVAIMRSLYPVGSKLANYSNFVDRANQRLISLDKPRCVLTLKKDEVL